MLADPGSSAVWVGLRLFACWDRGFESRQGHRCLILVNVVCCQVEVSMSGWPLVQRNPTEWVCLWSCSLDNEKALVQYGLLHHGKKSSNVHQLNPSVTPYQSQCHILNTRSYIIPTHSLWNVRCSLRMMLFKVNKWIQKWVHQWIINVWIENRKLPKISGGVPLTQFSPLLFLFVEGSHTHQSAPACELINMRRPNSFS
jgi:hypothetical protein